MNERLKELYQQAHSVRHYDGDPSLAGNPPTVYWQGEVSAQRFAELIVKECAYVSEGYFGFKDRTPGTAIAKEMKQHFGIEPEEELSHIGYTEREEGFYKIYAPPKGSIVTQAFILCKYCNGAIYHCGGPKLDAICFSCYDKDPELR